MEMGEVLYAQLNQDGDEFQEVPHTASKQVDQQ